MKVTALFISFLRLIIQYVVKVTVLEWISSRKDQVIAMFTYYHAQSYKLRKSTNCQGRSVDRRFGIVKVTQLQQFLRIVSTAATIQINTSRCLLNGLRTVTPPATAIFDRLIWVVDAEEDAVNAYLVHHILECRRGEVSAGGDLDILLKIIINGLLAHDFALPVSNGLLDTLEPVVYTPKVKGNVFSLHDQ
jgi:hypothetical protein